MFFKRLVAAVMALFISAAPAEALAQKLVEAGKTDCGILYIDTESVSTVKKDGKFYLTVFAEEKFTDESFLQVLRQGEDMQDASGAIYLYLFNSFGSEYFVASNYILSSDGKVCADLGAENMPRQVGRDKLMKNVYVMSIKILEQKKTYR